MDEQEFVSLLQALLQPDTQKVKAATGQLNKTYYSSPQSLPALIHILTSHQDDTLRHLAAVEARKLVSKHWAAVPEAQKPQSAPRRHRHRERRSRRRGLARVRRPGRGRPPAGVRGLPLGHPDVLTPGGE